MNITVSRGYKGRKDTKGNIVPTYNYKSNSSSTAVSTVKSATINTENTYDNPLRTTLTDFVLCVNFKTLDPVEYSCPDDLIIREQVYEVTEADLLVSSSAYTFDDLLPQFEKLTIIPSSIGVVLLIGKMKSSSVKTFTNYIEVGGDSDVLLEDREAGFADVTPGTAQTYDLDMDATYAYSILSVSYKADAGNILSGVAICVNGVPVVGLDNLSVTDTMTNTVYESESTISNSVAVGDVVTVVTSGDSSDTATYLGIKIVIQRI